MDDTKRRLTDEQQAWLKQIIDEITRSYDSAYLDAARNYEENKMRIDQNKEREIQRAVEDFHREIGRG